MLSGGRRGGGASGRKKGQAHSQLDMKKITQEISSYTVNNRSNLLKLHAVMPEERIASLRNLLRQTVPSLCRVISVCN